MFGFGLDRMMGHRVVTIPVPTIQVPARRHPRKKQRLQKKWLKKYGLKTVVDPRADLESMLVDEVRRVIYCYPHQEAQIRRVFQSRQSA